MLFYEDRQAKRIISLVAGRGCCRSSPSRSSTAPRRPRAAPTVGLYLLGNWPSPFAIVLVLDRLSALMLLLTAVLALPALVFAAAGWDRRGQHFHSLFQFLLMGLNGAFLTGDLFNLFVFFEVLLAASYGLVLHGSGPLRVRAGLHYIAINLAASLLFLIGVSLIYGVTGTLNMADLAVKAAAGARGGPAAAARRRRQPRHRLPGQGRRCGRCRFWLPITYMAAAPPVAADLRDPEQGRRLRGAAASPRSPSAPAPPHSAGLGAELLSPAGWRPGLRHARRAGLAGARAARRPARCWSRRGTLLAASAWRCSAAAPPCWPGALYYLVGSTLAIGALFLMVELLEREQGGVAAMLAVTAEAYGFGDEELDADEPAAELAVPGTMTVLGLCFAACALLLAGLPPLSGFLGKFAILSGMLNPAGSASATRRSRRWRSPSPRS